MFDNSPQPTTAQLVQTMETDAQLWNDLLWASGGALEQSKCSFHLIQSDWSSDGQPFLKGGVQPITIRLSHNDKITSTNQKSNYDSHKTGMLRKSSVFPSSNMAYPPKLK